MVVESRSERAGVQQAAGDAGRHLKAPAASSPPLGPSDVHGWLQGRRGRGRRRALPRPDARRPRRARKRGRPAPVPVGRDDHLLQQRDRQALRLAPRARTLAGSSQAILEQAGSGQKNSR